MVIIPSKRAPRAKRRQEDWDEAREAYLLAHAPGLKEHYAVQQRAFSQIKEDAQNRHPDPTPEDIAAALAAEAALPYRKRTEAQCVETLSLWQRTFPWTSRASASGSSNGAAGMEQSQSQPLTDEMQRVLTAEFDAHKPSLACLEPAASFLL